MTSFTKELDAPFERMSRADASTLLLEHYDVHPTTLTPLTTERDDTFQVETENGRLALKVAHPGDERAVIASQTAAMRHATSIDPALPLQRVLPTLNGELHPVIDGRVTRLLTWLDGDLMLAHWPDEPQMEATGRMLARLDRALEKFDHPATERTFAWDMQRLTGLRELLELAPTPAAKDVIDRFERHVLPQLADLPHQVIHGDFHPGNVLVDPEHPEFVIGVLDFGDSLHSARIIDLAIALAYLVPADEAAWPAIRPFIVGYESVLELTDLELDLLPDLVAARLVQRILLSARDANGRDDMLNASTRIAATLDNFMNEG